MAHQLGPWDPFRELDQMQEQMNRLFSRSLAGGSAVLVAMPSTDIYEEKDKLVIETALPTFTDEEVDVQVHQDRLEIKAEHQAQTEDKQRTYLRRESSTASYYRQFALPKTVDPDTAEANFENGVLRVSFAHKELPQPKKLHLGSGKKAKD